MNRRYWLRRFLVMGSIIGGGFAAGLDFGGQETVSYLDADRVTGTVPEHQTVAFSSLTPAKQRVFEETLADEERVTAIPDDVDRTVWVATHRSGTGARPTESQWQ